jgi:uncharacterized protein
VSSEQRGGGTASAERFGRIAAWASRRARPLLFATAIVAVAAAIGASQLDTDAGTDTLVSRDSSAFKATDEFHKLFGDDAVVILVEGDLRRLVLTKNLGRLLRLEGCLSGNVPKGVKPLAGPCTEIAKLKPAKVVYGPATFLNQAVLGIESALGGQIKQTQAQAAQVARAVQQQMAAQGASKAEQRQAAQAAVDEIGRRFQTQLLKVAANYGITRLPQIDDPLFVSQVVFDTRQPPGTPKARFSYLFPNRDSALISIRLRPDLSESERSRALSLFREAINDTTPRPRCQNQPCFKLNGGSYVVSGAPVVVDGVAGKLRSTLLVLFAAAVVVMAAMLMLVFRSRLRLLPLALALAAAAITFGLLGLIGGSLTIAAIAVLPVLIGLSVDYAIQLQARFDEAVAGGAGGVEAARLAASRAAPVVGSACIATAAGFLVLLLSPVPMVRGFGLMLVAGVAIAFGLAVTVGFAALSLRRDSPETSNEQRATRNERLRTGISDRVTNFGKHALAVSIGSPGRVLAVAFALAATGWVAGSQTEVVSDIRQLVPQDLREVRDLDELQDVTGVSGELDVLVRSPDVTNPHLVSWMSDFKQRVLKQNGFGGEFPSCKAARLCPGTSPTDFFTNNDQGLTSERIRTLYDAIPAYDLQAVLTRNPSSGALGHTANISFGIRVMPLDQQKALIDDIRSQIDPPGTGNGPPPGTEVRLAGLPVLAAESNSALAGSRYWLTLAGLVAVALALLAVYRSVSRALVPLIPIVLATGWSSLVIAASDIPLNPMSATLGALVIAIATEFSVILSSRYHEERREGRSVGEALRHSYSRTGAAVLASGLTAIAGFGTLVVTVIPGLGSYDFPMLRDFGFVTVVDLSVALLGVMLVLPAVLVWAEAGFEVRGVPLPRRLAALRR